MEESYALVFGAVAAVSAAIGIIAWRRRAAAGAIGLALYGASIAFWALAVVLQWVLTDHSPSLYWLAPRALCATTSAIGSLLLALDFAGYGRLLQKRLLLPLFAMPVATLVVILTEASHHLYLAGATPGMRVVGGGPWYLANGVYALALVIGALAFLILGLATRRGVHRLQAALLLVSVAGPWAVFIAESAGWMPMPGVNSMPVAFGLASILLAYGLFRLGLFRLVPVARAKLIDEMPLGMCVLDRSGRLVDANPAARRLLRLAKGGLGMEAAEVFSALAERGEPVLRLVQAGSGSAEVAAGPAGGRILDVTASEIADPAGERRAVLVVLNDITERVASERLRREFIANASHELQTPLTDLSLLGSTLEKVAANDPEQLGTFIDILKLETGRLVKMTRDLLLLSRLDEAPGAADDGWRTHDLGDIVTQELASRRGLADAKRQRISLDLGRRAPVFGDETGLHRAIGNLLENAMRYTDEHGDISVRVEIRDAEDQGGRWVVLAVSDTGIGIAPEEQDRVFERFYRVDKARSRQTGGSGLGLSIVKSVVERHGGSLDLTSELGAGSTFVVRLPLAATPEPEAAGVA